MTDAKGLTQQTIVAGAQLVPKGYGSPSFDTNAPALSPDGNKVAVGSWINGLYIIDVRTKDYTNPQCTKSMVRIDDVSWSPDGHKLFLYVAGTGSYVYNVDAQTCSKFEPPDVRWDAVYYGSWSPNGNSIAYLAFTTSAVGIFVMDSSGANVTMIAKTQQGGTNIPQTLSWSPDGKKIVFDSERGIFVIDSAGGDAYTIATNGNYPMWFSK